MLICGIYGLSLFSNCLLLGSEVGRNIVHLLSALAGQGSASLGNLRLFHQSELRELLENVAIDLTGTQCEVVRSATESLGTAEDLPERTDTDVGSDVNTTSDRSGSGVNPVSVIRSELLEGGSLDDISPLRIDLNEE